MADNHRTVTHANVDYVAVLDAHASLLLVLLLPDNLDDVKVH